MEFRQRFDGRVDNELLNNFSAFRNRAKHQTFSVEFNNTIKEQAANQHRKYWDVLSGMDILQFVNWRYFSHLWGYRYLYSGRTCETAWMLSCNKYGVFLCDRQWFFFAILCILQRICAPWGRLHVYPFVIKPFFGVDWRPPVLSWKALFNLLETTMIWRKFWGVGTDGRMKQTDSTKLWSQGNLRNFDENHKSLLFWCYLALEEQTKQ